MALVLQDFQFAYYNAQATKKIAGSEFACWPANYGNHFVLVLINLADLADILRSDLGGDGLQIRETLEFYRYEIQDIAHKKYHLGDASVVLDKFDFW